MKIIYILLIFSFWKTILNETDLDIEIKGVVPLDCEKTTEGEIYYGFTFTAVTSGFNQETSFQFYLKTPNYAFAECFVPVSRENVADEIICKINARQFPLYENSLILELPDIINNDKSIPISGMENVNKFIALTSTCYITYDSVLTPSFDETTYCSEGKNILNGYAEIDFPTGNLRNLKTTEYLIDLMCL